MADGDAEILVPTALAVPERRIVAIDPGSHWIAIVVVRVALPLRHVWSATIPIGSLVPLVKPKVIRLRNGGTRTRTHRRAILDGDLAMAVACVLRVVREFSPERCVIERASSFYAPRDKPSQLPAMAAAMMRAQWVGGELAGAVRATGVPVESCSSLIWRSHLRRTAPGVPMREAIVEHWNHTIPERCNEHVIDAAGLAAWAARSPDAPRAPRQRRGPRGSRPKRERVPGCECEGRHVSTCPVQVAANAMRSERARGNKNAMKGDR